MDDESEHAPVVEAAPVVEEVQMNEEAAVDSEVVGPNSQGAQPCSRENPSDNGDAQVEAEAEA